MSNVIGIILQIYGVAGDFADQLEEASTNVLEISKSKLLSLVPALVLGYFGLIHLAFALTGLALFTLSP